MKIKKKSEIPSGKRDHRNLREGSNRESVATMRSTCSKSISKQYFSCKEKRLGLPSGYKFENSESVCNLYVLQNGTFAYFIIHVEGRKLHAQN